ncbi:MAG TPA: hypothetical protein VFH25_08560 [Nitrososphaeraceae archaeon]|nr:hypothetical protein [Nitrososphaeraceae archaeon]
MFLEKKESRREEVEGQKDKEDNDNDDNDNILTKEVVSWKGFEYALRQPNASLFNKMLSEYLENKEEYVSAFKSRESQHSAESLFIALIFQQQKMISKLIQQLKLD